MKGNSKSVERAAKFLRKEVTNNSLKPGIHVSESAVAKKLNISRVPVREAIRILQCEGYLKVIPHRGCFVTKISLQYVYETSIVYRLLAPAVLKIAIPRYTVKTFKKAEDILCKIEKCKDFNIIGYHLWDFAKIIYSPSNMHYMLGVFDEIYKNSIRLLNELFADKDSASFKVNVHREFIELCKQNKSEEAIILWSGFIDRLISMILIK